MCQSFLNNITSKPFSDLPLTVMAGFFFLFVCLFLAQIYITWSKSNLSSTRIDYFYLFSFCFFLCTSVCEKCLPFLLAPLSDHKKITLKPGRSENTTKLRGYWEFNNTLLNDNSFNDSIENQAIEIFNETADNEYTQKWEYFKDMTRYIAIKS